MCGRDLPPADALAADQRITAYAHELRAAGLDGTMDQLRARAFLDFTLGLSSFPQVSDPSEDHARTGSPGTGTGDRTDSEPANHPGTGAGDATVGASL